MCSDANEAADQEAWKDSFTLVMYYKTARHLEEKQ